MMISPELLAQEGDLSPADWADLPPFPQDHVDFGWVIPYKTELFRRAARRFFQHGSTERHARFAQFCHENRDWLDDFSHFMAVKAEHRMVIWTDPHIVTERRRPPAPRFRG